MLGIPLNHQNFVVFLLASATSAKPLLPTLESIPSHITTDVFPNHVASSSSNSTSQIDYYEDKRTRIFKSYFVIAAIIFTSFCMLGLYLQHRRKIHATLKIRDAEERDPRIDIRMNRVNGINSAVECQLPGNREGTLYEGLDAQGEPPPPYVTSSKPPGLREASTNEVPLGTNEATITGQDLSSVEPPAYNELETSGQNQVAGNIRPAISS